MNVNEALNSISIFAIENKYALLGAAAGVAVFYSLKFILNFAVLPSQQICPRNNPVIGNAEGCFGEVIDTLTGAKINIRTFDFTADATDEEKNKTVVVFNPNGCVTSQIDGLAEQYFKGRYGKVVFWDYPNTGGSKAGKWFVDKESMILAGEAVAHHIAGDDFSNITFYGWSLGGGIAAEVAIKLQLAGKQISGLICDRTFTSIADFATKNIGIPKFITTPATWVFGININTQSAFEAFNGNKRSIYSHNDEVISNAILVGEGENYVEVKGVHMATHYFKKDELLTFARI